MSFHVHCTCIHVHVYVHLAPPPSSLDSSALDVKRLGLLEAVFHATESHPPSPDSRGSIKQI